MRTFRIVACLAALAAAGCPSRGSATKAAPAAPPVSHDARLLGQLLKLPGPPIEVAFEEGPVGVPGGLGPTDYVLVAVIRFAPGVVARLANAPGETGMSGGMPADDLPGRASLPGQPWFPDAVKAKMERAADGRPAVRGRAIDAEAMFRPRYSMGRGVQIDGTDYVVLVAETT